MSSRPPLSPPLSARVSSCRFPKTCARPWDPGSKASSTGGRFASVRISLSMAAGGWRNGRARALRRASWRSALSVFVSIDGRAAGALLLADELRRETPRAVRALRNAGVARIVMVTGDRADAAETIGAALDLDAVLADRVPADKVEAVALEQRLNPTLMVGDGINDAPALAAADVGIAMGARGASASSEAADVVILVDQLDRVSDAVVIARRTRAIAMQSIVVGMALSGLAMGAAAFGWLTPVAGALTQEAIDVAVILNALRALSPGRTHAAAPRCRRPPRKIFGRITRGSKPASTVCARSRTPSTMRTPKPRSNISSKPIALSQRISSSTNLHDESSVYPRLSSILSDGYGLFAMSRAHREILHMARLLARLADGLSPKDADRYLIRDGQRIIESIESLVRIHNAQEEDIYENAGSERVAERRWRGAGQAKALGGRGVSARPSVPKRAQERLGLAHGGRRPRRSGFRRRLVSLGPCIEAQRRITSRRSSNAARSSAV